MIRQKQIFGHDPENGIYGDCHRTAIASILNMRAEDVPHFMDEAAYSDPDEAHAAVERWLNGRGVTQINVLFPGEMALEDILMTVAVCNRQNETPLAFILGGKSRTGCNHSVVCLDGEIACDPSKTDAGIIGPCDDGYYWVTFFGALIARHSEAA